MGNFLTRTIQRLFHGRIVEEDNDPMATSYPQLGRLVVHPLRCRFCDEPLVHGDEILYFVNEDGWRSPEAHAHCAIFIKQDDGVIYTLNGSVRPKEEFRPGMLLLTSAEWQRWLAKLE